MEGGLIAPSLKMMSDGLHCAVARGDEMALGEDSVQHVLQFAAKCAKGAGFDKVRASPAGVSDTTDASPLLLPCPTVGPL